MDYLATYLDAYIQYYASDVQLHIDTGSAYLVLPKSRIRIAGFYCLTNTPNINDRFLRNGVILVELKTLLHIVASASEAQVAGVFHNSGIAISIRNK